MKLVRAFAAGSLFVLAVGCGGEMDGTDVNGNPVGTLQQQVEYAPVPMEKPKATATLKTLITPDEKQRAIFARQGAFLYQTTGGSGCPGK
ncbi:MAG: hypothetical protein ACOZIN_16070 [Myxococcota bacterium]